MPWNERTRRRLKLRDLDILRVLVETNSMGKAAKRLNISQPAISKAIAELERALDVRLVDRSRRGVLPTAYGLSLSKWSNAVFNDLRSAIQDIDFISDPTKGEIHVGTTDPIMAAIVSPTIDRISRNYPAMLFHVIADDTGALYRHVMERNVELAICRMIGPLPGELTAEILFLDSFSVMTAAHNPLTRRRSLKLSDLADEPWTLYPFDIPYGALVAEAFHAAGHEPPRRTATSLSFNAQRDLLATGRFITVLPSFILRVPGWHPPLKALPVSLPNRPMPVGIITLKGRMLTPVAELFIRNVRSLAKALAKS